MTEAEREANLAELFDELYAGLSQLNLAPTSAVTTPAGDPSSEPQ